MYRRENLGLAWWRRAALGTKLAGLVCIALLLVTPTQALHGAANLAAASEARSQEWSSASRPEFPAPRFAAPQNASSTLSGRVVNPDGSPFTSANSPNLDAAITVISFEGDYSFADLAGDGSFSIALEEGIYEVSVWLDSATYPSLWGPPPFYVGVSGPTPIGDIALVSRNVTISGSVTYAVTAPAAGVPITAWDAEGEQFSTITDGSGHYTLAVTPGDWQVSPDLQYSSSFFFNGDPEITQLDDGQSVTIDFSVEQTSGTIAGSIINENTSDPVTDIVGWAYVRRDGEDVLSWAPISAGTFSLPAPSISSPSDVLLVGLYLDPNSDYSSESEIILDNNTAPNFAVDMPVQPHDATIAGKIYIAEDATHSAVTQVDGLVVVTELDDSWVTPITKYAPIDPATGTYSIKVLPGNWLVSYQLFTDTFQADLSTPLVAAAVAQQSTPLDLPLIGMDGFVTAEVRDEDGVLQPNVTVWVRYGSQEVYAETDSQGQVTVYVPYSNIDLATSAIRPQGQQQPPITIGTSYSNCKKSLKADRSPPSGGGSKKCRNSSVVLKKAPKLKPKPGGLLAAAVDPPVTLSLRDTNGTLTGRVLNPGGQTARADAFVSAWSSNGQWISGATDASGAFSLPIAQDSTIATTWQVSASYWDSGAKKLLSKRVPVSVGVGHPASTPIAAGDLALEEITSALPPSESQLFNNSAGLTLPLSDGSLIQIPKNALPDGVASQIRITVDPQIALPSTDLNRTATYYGYAINLYDAQTGKPIEQPLAQPATITFKYTPAQLQQLGISEDALQPAQFADDAWHVADGFLHDRQGEERTISVKTRTLDSWALVVEQPVVAQAGGARVYVPLVAR
jgi:hypothetical protein